MIILIKLIFTTMNTNKKAILGFAVAMVFSLAFMQGNTIKSTKESVNTQQVAVGAAYMAGESERGAAGAWGAVSLGAGAVAYQALTGGAIFSWNPVGWAAVGVGAGAAL